MVLFCQLGFAQKASVRMTLLRDFQRPPEAAKPWVLWYWMQAAVSREGITADLEAMKEAGMGGAYLMPIRGVTNPPLFTPVVEQLSPLWWQMVRHALKEADRLGLKIAMHACDGFATAGGPWITPELSMQRVVWSETSINGGGRFDDTLPEPQNIYQNYFRDIAVYAFPEQPGAQVSSYTTVPRITTSKAGAEAQFLAVKNNKQTFRSEDSCWIRFQFEQPFTARSLVVRTDGRNYFSNRMRLEVSDDGQQYRPVVQLEPPRHGWQDGDADITHALPAVTARFFRFTWSKTGSEPGAEDLDAAKWKPALALRGIELSGAPRLHQYEGKNGSVWRISARTTTQQIADKDCVPLNKIINLTTKLDPQGRLTWDVPPGRWTVIRVGHTSTGQTNYIGGKGLGLECDKFNPAAITLQFNKWFGEAVKQAGPELASRVLKVLYVDSWECGSQNWSPAFPEEFKKRRGYDPTLYLLAMTGLPVESAGKSERFLSDVRETLAELVNDKFYKTLLQLAHAKGATFIGECVAPTMTSDGLLHFGTVDVPAGEFWLRSPTHDKLNDLLDAISGGHIYGKQIIQAEAFTELHMSWDEYPGMLKTLGDRNYALGVNRFIFHVFTHNPWMDHKPGMTLGRTGLLFQRDQTWWKPGRTWVDYIRRCQALLQKGRPVADVAVFTGEETPRRAILPDRLVPVLPGLFGPEVVASEQKRLANKGEPLMEQPKTIFSSANAELAEDWETDPLHGYAYDSYNRDALLRLSKVRNGRIELPGGASYGVLVVPGAFRGSPNGNLMTQETAGQLKRMVQEGATVLLKEQPAGTPGLASVKEADTVLTDFFTPSGLPGASDQRTGKGRLITGPYRDASFASLGLTPDLVATSAAGERAEKIAWTHRTAPGFDLYFLSNQLDSARVINLSLRVRGRLPELWDPLTGEVQVANEWIIRNGRTDLPVRLDRNGSLFLVFTQATPVQKGFRGKNWPDWKTAQTLAGPWQVQFDPKLGGPEKPVQFDQPTDWSRHADSAIRFYAGTAVYTQTFNWEAGATTPDIYLALDSVANLAEVRLNGISCGVAWTAPYRVSISKALKPGENQLQILVTNTWANRFTGDQRLPEPGRIMQTTSPYNLEGRPLLKAGLLGAVKIETSSR